MRVLAEIVDAALMDNQTIQRLAKSFVAAGAHLIDVGMVAGESRPADAKRIVEAVKQVVDVPVSVDTLDPAEIKAAVLAGADLVLSMDAGNIEDHRTLRQRSCSRCYSYKSATRLLPKESGRTGQTHGRTP